MSSTLPNICSLTPSTRLCLALVAGTTVLFCSCKATLPTGPGVELARTSRPSSVPDSQHVVTHTLTDRRAPSPASNTNPRTTPAVAAKVVTPQQFAADRQAAYPAMQVGYTEPVGAPQRPSSPAAPTDTASGMSRHRLPPNVRAVSNPPPTSPRPTSPPPSWPVRQASNVAVARPSTGHACAACQPQGTYPSLPTAPYGGAACEWPRPWQYGPWPSDEYLCNGGDNDLSVHVADDWSVVGLHEGDTIGHYDTLEGEVIVEPTNEVCLYAPRFASVRKVTGVALHEQHLRSAGLELPVQLALSGEAESATTVLQPVQAGRNLAIKSANRFREKMRPGGLENTQAALGARAGLLPFEDFLIIRDGRFDNNEKARLSAHLQAAYTWSHDASVQVVVDNIDALEASNEVGMESVYTYEMPDGKPCLRLVKVASKQNALPGETVDFTIRFDNVGDRIIGNVTVIDNLNTRLEYVPDSQECSLEANFLVSDNEHESSVLRWEIDDPMKVGSGGVIRFQCRVR